jgi:hypothetical protein
MACQVLAVAGALDEAAAYPAMASFQVWRDFPALDALSDSQDLGAVVAAFRGPVFLEQADGLLGEDSFLADECRGACRRPEAFHLEDVRLVVLLVARDREDVRDLGAEVAGAAGSTGDDNLDDTPGDSRPTNKDCRNIDNRRRKWCALPSSCPNPNNRSHRSCC